MVGPSDEPVFDIEDDLHTVLTEIGGWSYLFDLARADHRWYEAVIAPENLVAFAHGCDVLAEEYGDASRQWSGDATGDLRAWTVTGSELRAALTELARVGRSAEASHAPLTVRSDAGWVEQTSWQEAGEAVAYRAGEKPTADESALEMLSRCCSWRSGTTGQEAMR